MTSPAEYWRNNDALNHITPARIEFPEVGLFPALQKVCQGSVFDYGCGYGRLAPAFDPDSYYGMDINDTALDEARKRNPVYSFGKDWQSADTVLAYTVMLHIPDDEIVDLINKMRSYRRIVIGEIMGRRWRRPGNPPVFNREADDYCEIVGRDLVQIEYVPYPRYKESLTLLVFDND